MLAKAIIITIIALGTRRAILQKRAVETNGRTELGTGYNKKDEATARRSSSEIEQSQGIGRVSKKKGAE